MNSLVIRGPEDHRRLVELIDSRRLEKSYAWRDVYDRTPGGMHNGFNRVVADVKGDYKVTTLLNLLVALDLEVEVRPRPSRGRKLKGLAATEAPPESADSSPEGAGE